MQRRPVLAVALAALLVLAGCSTPGQGDGADGTPTPDSSQMPDSLPPGVGDDGTVNETRLTVETFVATNETAWRIEHSNAEDQRTLYGSGETRVLRNERGVTWSRGSRYVTNSTSGDATLESASGDVLLSDKDGSGVLVALALRLETSTYEWTGVRTVDGTRLHELTMTDAKGLGHALDHYTGTMLVDDEGHIHRLSGEVGENESTANRYRFDFAWDVESVPRPPWLDDVPRVSGEKTPDRHALRVEVTGGDLIPAGTDLSVRYNGTTLPLTLSEPLAPGESLFVAIENADGDRSAVVTREPPTRGGLLDISEGRVRLTGAVSLRDGTPVSLEVAVGELAI